MLSLLLAPKWSGRCRGSGLTSFSTDPAAVASISSVAQIGVQLFTTHAFAFEVTSILILVAMVGAVVIAGKARHER